MSTLAQHVADWYLTNMRIRHGHPPKTTDLTGDETLSSPSSTGQQAQAATTPLLATATRAAAVVALGGLGSWLVNEWMQQPAATPTPEQAATTERDGSLYQYLEDNQYHLPEASP